MLPHRHSSWLILAVILLAGTVGPSNMYKVPPLMPVLMNVMSLSKGKAGLLMSILCAAGVCLSLPAGFLFQRLGYRATGILAMAFLCVGAGLGSVSASAAPMLGTRLIEGVGATLMSVTGPALISLRFSGRRRATALGIWTTYVPVGAAITFNVAPFLESLWGWQSVWWAGSLYALSAGILYFLVIKPRPEESLDRALEADSGCRTESVRLGMVVCNRDLWLLSLSYFFACVVFFSFVTWAPTYFFAVRHKSLASASQLAGLLLMVGIVGGPASGWILSRIKSTKSVLVLSLSLVALAGPLTVSVGTAYLPLFVIVYGVILASAPTSVFFVLGEVIRDKRLSGMGMGVLNTLMYAGLIMGPILFGYTLDIWGTWEIAFLLLLPWGAAAVVSASLIRVSGSPAYLCR